jgi:hypothetical protein
MTGATGPAYVDGEDPEKRDYDRNIGPCGKRMRPVFVASIPSGNQPLLM